MGIRTLKLAACLLVLNAGFAVSAETDKGDFVLRVDISAAQAVLDLFDSEQAAKEDVVALLDHPAIRATITQTSRFDSMATDQVYVDSLWQVLNGETPEADPFNFSTVRERLPDTRKLLSEMSERRSELEARIRDRLWQYTPSQTRIETTMFAVIGGTSDGWAPGDGGFYIAVHYFRDDVPGLTAMVTHETYHIVQKAFFHDQSNEQSQSIDLLLASLIGEGTATLVGDPSRFEGDGRYLRFLKSKHSRNLARINENVALFEALYLRVVNDPAVEFGPIYNIGFSGSWSSPLYFVGFRIAEGLEKHLGRDALIELLAEQSPAQILATYVQVYTESDDPELIRFSPATESIIAKQR